MKRKRLIRLLRLTAQTQSCVNENVYLTRPGSELALRTGVFDPTWLDPVAESTVAPATGSSQVGSNTNSYKLVLKPVDIES